jgi:hypothetical protein
MEMESSKCDLRQALLIFQSLLRHLASSSVRVKKNIHPIGD